jgi:hypothetical protein
MLNIEASNRHAAEISGDRSELIAALMKLQTDMPTLQRTNVARIRTRDGNEYTYRYADLSDTLDTLRPLLKANELLLQQYTEVSAVNSDTTLMLITEIVHIGSGQYIRECTPVPWHADSPKTSFAALTSWRRYAIQTLLGMSSEDPDSDIEALAQQELIKTRDHYPPLIAAAIEDDDPLAAKAVIDSLSEWQYNVVWKELTTKQKNRLREWRSSAYGTKPKEPQPLSEKDQRRADQRNKTETENDESQKG